MRYRWILFDLDGTLFDYRKSEAAALERTFGETRLRFDPAHAELYRRINERVWLELERGEITREELKVRRFVEFFDAAGLAGDPASFNDRYLENLAGRSDLIAGAERLLRTLVGKLRMVLLTNGLKSVQSPRLLGSVIRGYFEAVVISEEVGFVKPDPRIFDAAFSRMGHPEKDEVLIVGDSLTSDIRGGSDYGIDTCWFNPAAEPRDVEVEIRYEVRELSEVAQIVGVS